VEFIDTGHGMSSEQQRRAFSSVLSTTKAKGTGLGLAIVARVVETHGGQVKIKSRVGAGTTVTVLLPLDGRSGDVPAKLAKSMGWPKLPASE
jgi:two-component system, NtrC family, sensor histidine kinase HydH